MTSGTVVARRPPKMIALIGTPFGSSQNFERTGLLIAGAVGELRFDPFAMLPFCGYNMADYFAHWLEIGRRAGVRLPKIFRVNWFRKNASSEFLWPGYGENARVLEWVFRRCDNDAGARETPIGLVPTPADLDLRGLELTPTALAELLEVDRGAVGAELRLIRNYLSQFGDRLPGELGTQLARIESRLHRE